MRSLRQYLILVPVMKILYGNALLGVTGWLQCLGLDSLQFHVPLG